jgi:phage gp16-like protein
LVADEIKEKKKMRNRLQQKKPIETKEVSASELVKMKEELERKSQKVSELKGRIKVLMEQLGKEFECSTVEEAESLVEDLKKELQEKEIKLSRGIEKLMNKYNWDFAEG